MQFLVNGRVVRLDLAQFRVDLALELVHLRAHLLDVVVKQSRQLLILRICTTVAISSLILLFCTSLQRVLTQCSNRLNRFFLNRLNCLR